MSDVKSKRGRPKKTEIIENETEEIIKDFKDKDIQILAPIIRQRKGTYEKNIEDLKNEGYTKVRVNKKIISTSFKQ